MTVKTMMLTGGLVLAMLLGISQANATPTQPKDGFTRREATFFTTIQVNNSESLPLVDRITRLSSILLGAPYADGALGEGSEGLFDQDPLYRFDEFDCTTYVETVLAGALSNSPSDFLTILDHIRYKDGDVAFIKRNHFPSADWFPNNRNILTDITKKIAGKQTKEARAVIDKKSWYRHMTMDNLQLTSANEAQKRLFLHALHHAGDGFKPQIAKIDYVPLTALFVPVKNNSGQVVGSKVNLAILKKIPTGSIISMIRPNWNLKKVIGTNMNVSHQAILVRKEGKLYLRHASEIKGKVVDQNFVRYLFHYRNSPTLKGFNVAVLKANA